MKIAFLLYPTAGVKVDEDSSFWIMRELSSRGHEAFYFQSEELFWRSGSAFACLRRAKLHSKRGYLPSPPLSNARDLAKMDCIFVRKEPPFDNTYLYALQMLDLIKDKTFVLNDPAGIAMAGEKTFPLLYPDLVPESLVTENVSLAREFVADLGTRVILKPLNFKGGKGIVQSGSRDRNLPSLLEAATNSGKEKILVQRFIDTDRHGDKRIVVLDGRILGAFLRRPSRADFRANLSAGGTMHKASVSKRDLKIVETLLPLLNRHGLWFTGLDVIGGFLTEVNVTSPAGIPELKHFDGTRPESAVADFIEKRAGRRRF